MIIYPKGNDKDNGSGYISMYLEIDSTSLMIMPTLPSEVFADVRFFVFNKKENKYFTIQDVEPKLFNSLNPVWGLPQVLQLGSFNDPKNGYIFGEDQCEFGVDVIVAPPPYKWETISFDVELSNPKFSWTVNFSELKEYGYTSDSFSMGGINWALTIHLYPEGDTKRDGKWLSIFLLLADSESKTLMEYEKIFAQGRVRLLDPVGLNHTTGELMDWHVKSNSGWGWDRFVSLAEVRKTYFDEDETLNFEIEFEVVSATKYSLL